MRMNALALTSMAAVSTSVGGYCAIRLRTRIHLLMAFGAGVLVGAACLDLLPAAVSAADAINWPARFVFEYAALGAALFFFLRRVAVSRAVSGKADRTAGRVSAVVLILHSTLDGTAIFAASTISLQMGLIVGLGIVAHDSCDGLNTVLLSTRGGAPEWKDYGLLALDALAPIAGGLIASHFFSVSQPLVTVFLSLAGGSFLFTALLDLLPEAYRIRKHLSIPALSFSGFAFVWLLTRVLGA
jgi:zinc transporter ZupT